MLLALLGPRLGGLGMRRLLKSLAGSLLGTAVMAGVLFWFLSRWGEGPALLVTGAGILLGGLVYGVVVLLLGRQEIAQLRRRL